jgi:hypothetical protein
MVYKNDKSLNYILMEEGRVNKSLGVYVYEYHLKYHLGITRWLITTNYRDDLYGVIETLCDLYAAAIAYEVTWPQYDFR